MFSLNIFFCNIMKLHPYYQAKKCLIISACSYQESGNKNVLRTDIEEPLRKYFETSGWVCYREQVVDMCRSTASDAHIPQWKYITVIKGLFPLFAFFLFYKSENLCLFLREEKKPSEPKGSAAIMFLRCFDNLSR